MQRTSGADQPPWTQPEDVLLAGLAARREGLSAGEAAARLRRQGPNAIHEAPAVSALGLFGRQFQSPLVLILVFAGAIAFTLREWIEASIILAMVLGSTLLGFLQEHRASRAVAALRRRLALTARVRRGAEVVSIPVTELVTGDVVLLSAGVLIPADGRVLQANGLLVSEAALTGESFPVDKQPGIVGAEAPLTARTNCLYMGSSVRSGAGEMVVMATGAATEFGEVAERLKRKPEETDFSRGVRNFGLLLIRVMFAIVLFVLIVNQLLGRPFIDSLLFSVALGLGMSPELLPAIISVTLSAGAVRLARKGVIVRKLEAIENLGGMTVFCTDKTGTLTEGRIRMTGALDPAGQPSDAVARLGFLNAAFETGIENPMDQAVVAEGRAAGFDPSAWVKLDEIPYDFVRKRLSVAVRDAAASGPVQLVLKGAFDQVLPLCATVRGAAGPEALTAGDASAVRALHEAKSREGLRLLAVATRELPARPRYGVEDERELVLEGFLVFLDPPKADAAAVVRQLAELGVTVKVVSGDNRHVVRHLAGQIGLPDQVVITGAEVAALKESALANRAEAAALFAEVDPQQKERILRALQRRGHSVGYLGDGINDAPALYAADVGISVDQAVDVARESADVVLLQRDLGVLRDGIEGGRRTFANTLKYICITTSANFGNMVSMALAAPLLPFLPLAAKQILLNNLLSDLPSMAISGDAVDAERLARAQRMRIGDIQRFMIAFGLISSVFDLSAFAVLLYAFRASEPVFQTAWFVLSLLTELAVVLLLRTRGPAWRSRPSALLGWTTAGVGLAAVALPYSGPLARLFGLVPLAPAVLAGMLALTLAYLAVTEAAKLAFYRAALTPTRNG